MMKKKILKALAIVGCAALLVAGSIAGTFAYLTAKTETVTNTFTAGNVKITLTETKVNEYGIPVDANGNPALDAEGKPDLTARLVTTKEGNEYKLIPGHTYVKDPTISVTKGSEECYLYVKVENGISGIETTATIDQQLSTNQWSALNGVAGVYYKIVDARSATEDIKVPVFDTFTIATNADVSGYATANNANVVINVTAYAIQADGFATAEAAWTALNQQLNLNH